MVTASHRIASCPLTKAQSIRKVIAAEMQLKVSRKALV